MTNENFLLRGARNTLLDMLLEPIGATYPLFDLPVKPIVDVVYFNNSVEVRISTVQPDVSYQIYEDARKPYKGQSAERGTDLVLKSGTLKEQVHVFRVKATKILYREPNAQGEWPPEKAPLSNNLFQVASFKIGINTGLAVIPEKETVNYGEKISVVVKDAQRGAYYSIIYHHSHINNQETERLLDISGKTAPETVAELLDGHGKVITPAYTRLCKPLLGNDADLRLETLYGLREDMELHIAVFDKKTGLSGILNTVTTISVTPNLNLSCTWVSGKMAVKYNKTGAADYGSMISIQLNDAQQTAQYRVRLDQIDADGDEPSVNDFLSDWKTGKNGVLNIKFTSGVKEDLIVRVIARKIASRLDGELPSQVFIAVYPNTNLKVLVGVNPDRKADGKVIKVYTPQRGIIYQLRNVKTGKLLQPPFFYHRNKGIGNTRIVGSFMATDYNEGDAMDTDWMVKPLFVVDETIEQEYIELPTGALVVDTKFDVLATKSTTGITTFVKTITAKS